MIEAVRSKPLTRRVRGGTLPDVVRLRRATWAFTTRRVRTAVFGIALEPTTPNAGDLLLARVDAVGYHSALQVPEGRRKHLFIGDEIVVAYGNRYAPNQFEAVVPKTLGPCQLVAAGGVAGKVLSWHASVSKSATQITPLGLLTDPSGRPVNLRDHALPSVDRITAPWPLTIAVVGTAMDSGKTQTAAHLVKGLTLAGLRVGYAKVTGTGSGGDTWLLKDAGAHPVLDFTDAGLVSTYLETPLEVQRVFQTLMTHLTKSMVDAVVIEVADGVLQKETEALLESAVFKEVAGGILFAAGDAMGAVAGTTWLRNRNLPLIALSGVLTSSPLQRRESANATGLPVYSRQDLAQAAKSKSIMALAKRPRPEPARGAEPEQAFREGPGTAPPAADPAVRSEDATSVVEVTP